MLRKQKNVSRYWHEDSEEWKKFLESGEYFDFNEFDSLKRFAGTHPAVMQERIRKKNWHVDIDLSKKKFSFKDNLLYRFEMLTGIRPFDFRNYKVI